MNRIKELRKQHELTQEELGSIINVQKAAISKYELERATPSTDILKKLADYFNVTTDYLLGRTDEPQGTGFQKGLLGDADSLAEKVDRQDVVTASPPLTPDEIIHIKKYRALSDKGKQIIDMNLDQLKEIINNSKKE